MGTGGIKTQGKIFIQSSKPLIHCFCLFSSRRAIQKAAALHPNRTSEHCFTQFSHKPRPSVLACVRTATMEWHVFGQSQTFECPCAVAQNSDLPSCTVFLVLCCYTVRCIADTNWASFSLNLKQNNPDNRSRSRTRIEI